MSRQRVRLQRGAQPARGGGGGGGAPVRAQLVRRLLVAQVVGLDALVLVAARGAGAQGASRRLALRLALVVGGQQVVGVAEDVVGLVQSGGVDAGDGGARGGAAAAPPRGPRRARALTVARLFELVHDPVVVVLVKQVVAGLQGSGGGGVAARAGGRARREGGVPEVVLQALLALVGTEQVLLELRRGAASGVGAGDVARALEPAVLLLRPIAADALRAAGEEARGGG